MPPPASSDERPSPLLVTAAALHFTAAVLLLFLPQEILGWLGAGGAAGSSPLHPALLQVLAAALLGFAMLDWMNRFTRIGGIYGRPVVLANFAHAAVAALSLGRAALDGPAAPALWASLAVYAALAVAFGSKLFLAPRR